MTTQFDAVDTGPFKPVSRQGREIRQPFFARHCLGEKTSGLVVMIDKGGVDIGANFEMSRPDGRSDPGAP